MQRFARCGPAGLRITESLPPMVTGFLYADFIGAGESLISSAEEKFAVTLDPSYKRFLTEFFTEALAGIFVDWLKNHRRQDRDEIVRYLSVTVRRSLEGIFLGLQEG